MAWLQLTVQTGSPEQAEHVSEVLTELGAMAVTQTSEQDEEIFEPPINTTPLWQRTVCTGLFKSDANQQKGEFVILVSPSQSCSKLLDSISRVARNLEAQICTSKRNRVLL